MPAAASVRSDSPVSSVSPEEEEGASLGLGAGHDALHEAETGPHEPRRLLRLGCRRGGGGMSDDDWPPPSWSVEGKSLMDPTGVGMLKDSSESEDMRRDEGSRILEATSDAMEMAVRTTNRAWFIMDLKKSAVSRTTSVLVSMGSFLDPKVP